MIYAGEPSDIPNEFSYRFNRRDEQEEMFDETARNLLNGKALSYKKWSRDFHLISRKCDIITCAITVLR
jgi:hypothetical protein